MHSGDSYVDHPINSTNQKGISLRLLTPGITSIRSFSLRIQFHLHKAEPPVSVALPVNIV